MPKCPLRPGVECQLTANGNTLIVLGLAVGQQISHTTTNNTKLTVQFVKTEQEELSAELEHQEEAARRLAATLQVERSMPDLGAAAAAQPPSERGLARVPTEAVLGPEWGGEVRAAQAAQAAVRVSLDDGDPTSNMCASLRFQAIHQEKTAFPYFSRIRVLFCSAGVLMASYVKFTW